MRFLANENFPLESVRLLRQAGQYVFAASEDAAGAKDAMLLDRAVRDNMAVLTFDRDYGELVFHRKMPCPIGIIYFRFDPQTPAEPAEYVLKLLALSNLTLEKQFTVVERDQIRQRPLPTASKE